MMRKRLVSLILAFLMLALSAGASAMQPSPDSALGVIVALCRAHSGRRTLKKRCP